MRTSNHANIILWVYVRFTFKWNVDCCWCMDYILMMWMEHVCQLPTRCVSSTKKKKFTVALGLKSRVVTGAIEFLNKVKDPIWSLHLSFMHVYHSFTCSCQLSHLSSCISFIFQHLFFIFSYFYLKEKDSYDT
jgi:hypothetical protein